MTTNPRHVAVGVLCLLLAVSRTRAQDSATRGAAPEATRVPVAAPTATPSPALEVRGSVPVPQRLDAATPSANCPGPRRG